MSTTTPTPDGVYIPDSGDKLPLTEILRRIAMSLSSAIADAKGDTEQQVAAAAWGKGELASGTDLNDLTVSGHFVARSNSVAATLVNWPPQLADWAGHLEVLRGATGLTVQRVTGFAARSIVVQRTSNSVTQGTYTAWQQIAPAPPAAPVGDVTDLRALAPGAAIRADKVGRFWARRGGAIGTAGKGAVALRFDHHLDPFRTLILPRLVARRLPFCLVINPERIGSGDDNATWAEITQWCRDNGGEVFNHGGDHGDASTTTELVDQIVGSLNTLEAQLPALKIEGWAPPGLADGGYGGAAPFKTVMQNSGTFAGQLITGNHAVVAGYSPGIYRPLRGENPIGANHYTMDQITTLATIAGRLDTVSAAGEGLALMLHPNYLGKDGYMPEAVLDAVLDNIVARRDAGTIEVLSYSGLWAADSSRTARHSLLPPLAAPVSLAAAHTARVAFSGREHMLGGCRQLAATLTSAAGATVTLAVTGSTLTRQATVTVPAGTQTVRLPFTIPLDHTGWLEFSVSAVSGAPSLQQLRAEAM